MLLPKFLKKEKEETPVEGQKTSSGKSCLIKVFLVEDDLIIGKALQFALEKQHNYDVTLFTNGKNFLENLHLNPDIVAIDYNLPDTKGIELLNHINNYNKDISSIIVSGQEEVEVVVQAYKNGAKDYIIKGNNTIVELCNSIKNLSVNISLRKEVEDLKDKIINRELYNQIIGDSPAILSTIRLIQKVEKSNMMVLVTGESGSGKEMIGKVIHYNSPRKRAPYVAVNMAAIPEDLIESELFGHEKGAFTGADSRRIGKFEEANEGTIFLDEIGEMDLKLQCKMLRVLQESCITRVGSNKEIKLDVRVIAATNRNLMQMVKEGKFREDLYYRLNGFLLHLPPLRERGNDIILLAKHFLKEFCQNNNLENKNFSREALEALLNYHWPGNIRELKTTVQRAAIISDNQYIITDDLVFSPVS